MLLNKGCCFRCGGYDTMDRLWWYKSHRAYLHMDEKDCEQFRYRLDRREAN